MNSFYDYFIFTKAFPICFYISCPSRRPSGNISQMLYAAGLLVPFSTPKVEDKAMSAVREYFWSSLICGEVAHYGRNENFSMGGGGDDPECI